MPYVTSVERLHQKIGEDKGSLSNAIQSILTVLEVRFQTIPNEISDRLNSLNDLPTLQNLLTQAVLIASVDEFLKLISVN